MQKALQSIEADGLIHRFDGRGYLVGAPNAGIRPLRTDIRQLGLAIPDKIDVEVSQLAMHQYIRISELQLPGGVKVLDDPERVVVGVTHLRAEAIPTPEAAVPVEEVLAEPEVIPRGKKPEEEQEE